MLTESSIKENLELVRRNIKLAFDKRKELAASSKEPRLVAVSKTKPVTDIIEAYKCGQRHFGENYVQELIDKASSPQIIENCPDICWHMIGHLQRNKVNKVVPIPNLYMVETVDSPKLADSLNSSWKKQNNPTKLKVLVQVNTSGEESKSGIEPSEVHSLVKHLLDNCPALEFTGLMTIGALDHNTTVGPNEDFLKLAECLQEICTNFNMDKNSLELSMGMSGDYEQAIYLGSTNVRIGSTIFGSRNYNN